MTEKKWHWQGGRLVSEDGFNSLSTVRAYHMIPTNESIAKACKGVLKPYRKSFDDLLVKENQYD